MQAELFQPPELADGPLEAVSADRRTDLFLAEIATYPEDRVETQIPMIELRHA